MSFKEHFTYKNIIFVILFLIALKFLTMVSDIILLFFACFVIACSLLPLVQSLDKKLKNRTLSSVLVISASVIVTFSVILPILSITIDQFTTFAQTIPHKIAEIQEFLQNFSIAGHHAKDYIDFNQVINGVGNIAQEILNKSVNITIGFAQSLIVLIAILTIIFYMIKDANYMKNKFIEFFPDNFKDKADDIVNKIASKVGGYVIGTIISGVAIWVMITLILFILRVDYSITLGLISGVLDIIPVLGPTIALTLIILTAYKKGTLIIALVIIAFLGVQQISNNVVRPIVFGKLMDLHPLVIIFALLVGAQFGGLVGVIFAPAIAAIVTVLIDELYLNEINKK